MKAKAMKKTLSCILALTLTASMMAENLTAFATLDAPGIVEEDNVIAPVAVKASQLMNAAKTGVYGSDKVELKSMKIEAPTDFRLYATSGMDDEAIAKEFAKVSVVATFTKYVVKEGVKTANGTLVLSAPLYDETDENGFAYAKKSTDDLEAGQFSVIGNTEPTWEAVDKTDTDVYVVGDNPYELDLYVFDSLGETYEKTNDTHVDDDEVYFKRTDSYVEASNEQKGNGDVTKYLLDTDDTHYALTEDTTAQDNVNYFSVEVSWQVVQNTDITYVANPKTSGWYEESGGVYSLTGDETPTEGKTYYTQDGVVYEAVTPVGTENPSGEGWYEMGNTEYVPTTDTTVEGGKTYYKQSPNYEPVNVPTPSNPHDEGWYVMVQDSDTTEYEVSSDTTPESNKTYYKKVVQVTLKTPTQSDNPYENVWYTNSVNNGVIAVEQSYVNSKPSDTYYVKKDKYTDVTSTLTRGTNPNEEGWVEAEKSTVVTEDEYIDEDTTYYIYTPAGKGPVDFSKLKVHDGEEFAIAVKVDAATLAVNAGELAVDSTDTKLNDLSEKDGEAYKKGVEYAYFVSAKDKKYYLGQTINVGFLNDYIELYNNDGTKFELPEGTSQAVTLEYKKAISIAGSTTYQDETYETFNNDDFLAYNVDGEIDAKIDKEDTTKVVVVDKGTAGKDYYAKITAENQASDKFWSEKSGTHRISFYWQPKDSAVANLLNLEYPLIISANIYIEQQDVTGLSLNEEAKTYKTAYSLNQSFTFGAEKWSDAVIDVATNVKDATSYLFYAPTTYNGETYAWYLADTVDEIAALNNATEQTYADKLKNLDDVTSQVKVTLDTSKATAEGATTKATIEFGGQTLELTDIKVASSKISTAAVTVKEVEGADERTANVKVNNSTVTGVVFANRDTLDFVKGEVEIEFTYASGVKNTIDLAEKIDLFTTDAAGTKPAKDATVDQETGNTDKFITLYYQGEDKPDDGLEIKIPAMIITDVLTIETELGEGYKKVYYKGETPDVTGIQAKIRHTSWQQEAKSEWADLATLAKDSNWTITWATDKLTNDTAGTDESHALTIAYSKGIVSAETFESTEDQISVVTDYITGFTLSETPVKSFVQGTYPFSTVQITELQLSDVISGVKITPNLASKNGEAGNPVLLSEFATSEYKALATVAEAVPTTQVLTTKGKKTINVTLTPAAIASITTTTPIQKSYEITVEEVAVKEAKFAMEGDSVNADDRIGTGAGTVNYGDDTIVTSFTPADGKTVKVSDIITTNTAVILTYTDGKKEIVTSGLVFALKDGDIDASTERTTKTAFVIKNSTGTQEVEVPVTIKIENQKAAELVSLKAYNSTTSATEADVVEVPCEAFVDDTTVTAESTVQRFIATFKDANDDVFTEEYKSIEDFLKKWEIDTTGANVLDTSAVTAAGSEKTLGLTFKGNQVEGKEIKATVKYAVIKDYVNGWSIKAPTKTNYLASEIDDKNMIVPADGYITILHADKKLFEKGEEKIALADIFADESETPRIAVTATTGTEKITYTLKYQGTDLKTTSIPLSDKDFTIEIVADVIKEVKLTAPTNKISGYFDGQAIEITDGSVLITPELGDPETLDIPKILSGYNSTDTNSWYSHADVVYSYVDKTTGEKKTDVLVKAAGAAETDPKVISAAAAKSGNITVTITIDDQTVSFDLEVQQNVAASLTLGDGVLNATSGKVEGTVKDDDGNVVPALTFIDTVAKKADGTTPDTSKGEYFEGTVTDIAAKLGDYYENVLVTYKDGSKKVLAAADASNFTLTGFNADKVGEQTVTIEYKNKDLDEAITTTFTVTVLADYINNVAFKDADNKKIGTIGAYVTSKSLFQTGDKAILTYAGSGKTVTVDLTDEKQFSKYFAFAEGKAPDFSKVVTGTPAVAELTFKGNPDTAPADAIAADKLKLNYTVAADTAKVAIEGDPIVCEPGAFPASALSATKVKTTFTNSKETEEKTLLEVMSDSRYLVTIDNRLTGTKAATETLNAAAQTPGEHIIYVSWIDTDTITEVNYDTVPSITFYASSRTVTDVTVTDPEFVEVNQYDTAYDTVDEIVAKWADETFAITVTYSDGKTETFRGDEIVTEASKDNGIFVIECDDYSVNTAKVYNFTITSPLVGDKEVTIPVTVKAVSAAEISKVSVPTKREYAVGQELDVTGWRIKVPDGAAGTKEIAVTKEMVSGFDTSKVTEDGKYMVLKVTYGGKTLTYDDVFTVVKPDTALSITLTTLPKKLEYSPSESISIEGAKADIYYQYGSSEKYTVKNVTLTDDMFDSLSFTNPLDTTSGSVLKTTILGKFKNTVVNTPGNIQLVTNPAENYITVNVKVLRGIEITGYKKDYYVATAIDILGSTTTADKLDLETGNVTMTYQDGTTTTITLKEFVAKNPSGITYNSKTATANTSVETGKDEITLSYAEGGVTKTTTAKLNLIENSVTGIEVANAPTKSAYAEGDAFDATGLTVNVKLATDGETDKHEVAAAGKCVIETENDISKIANDGKFHIYGFDSSKAAAKQTLTIAYKETETSETVSAQFDVAINAIGYKSMTIDAATEADVKGKTWITANTQDDILEILADAVITLVKNDEKATTETVDLFDEDGNITTGFVIAPVDFTSTGAKTVTITYGDLKIEIPITVSVKQIVDAEVVTTLAGLSDDDKAKVTSLPVMEYEVGAEFDRSKGFLKVVFNNDKTDYVPFTDERILVQSFDTSAISDAMKFNIIYLDDETFKAATLTVKVTAPKITVKSITPETTELTYEKNEELTYLNTKVDILYGSDTTPVTMTLAEGIEAEKLSVTIKTAGEEGGEVEAIDNTKAGEYVLTITSREDSNAASATINVKITEKSAVSLTLDKAEFEVPFGAQFDAAAIAALQIKATVKYDDETETVYDLVKDADKFTIDSSAVNTNKAGTYDIKVTLKEDTDIFAVIKLTVREKIAVSSLTLSKTSYEYKVGDTIAIDAKATITYSEGDPAKDIALDNALLKVEIYDENDKLIDGVDSIAKIPNDKAAVYKIKVMAAEDVTKSATITVTVKETGKIDVDEEDPTPVVPVSENAVVAFEKSGEDWVEKAGYDSLTAAFDKTAYGAKTATGDYMFVITGKVSEAKALKFPANAKSITIVGDEDAELNLGKATTINAKNADITLNVKVTGAGLNVSVGAGKTLTVGSLVEKLGKVAGNKNSSKFVATGDVTVDNIQTFAEVDVNGDSVLTINTKGKMNNIAKLKAQVRFIDNTSTAAGITADQAIFHLVQNTGAKQQFAKVTLAGITAGDDSFVEVCIEDSNLEEVKLDETTPTVLWTTGAADLTKDGKISIVNSDDENNELSAVSYNKNKEIRAENTALLEVEIGEDQLTFSSFEKAFEYLADKSGAATITLNGPATLAKATLPKGLSSLTIKGDGTAALTVNATAIKATYDLAFINVPIIAKAASATALPINLAISTTGSKLTIEDVMFDAKSVKLSGNKKATELVIGGVNGVVDNIENFAKVTVSGAIAANKKLTVGTIAFDGGQLSLGNGAAAKIDNIEGTGVLGLTKAATAKKFKAITLTAMSADAKVTLVKVETEADGNGYKIMVIKDGDFEAGTVIFADKSKGAIKYGGDDAQFDASELAEGAELELNNKKVTLVIK